MHPPIVRSRSSARLSGKERAPRILATGQTYSAAEPCHGRGTKNAWCALRESEHTRCSQRCMRPLVADPTLSAGQHALGHSFLMLRANQSDESPDDGTSFCTDLIVVSAVA